MLAIGFFITVTNLNSIVVFEYVYTANIYLYLHIYLPVTFYCIEQYLFLSTRLSKYYCCFCLLNHFFIHIGDIPLLKPMHCRTLIPVQSRSICTPRRPNFWHQFKFPSQPSITWLLTKIWACLIRMYIMLLVFMYRFMFFNNTTYHVESVFFCHPWINYQLWGKFHFLKLSFTLL